MSHGPKPKDPPGGQPPRGGPSQPALALARPPESEPAGGDPRPVHPTEKEMGMVPLVLDKGIRTTAIGVLYGLDFEVVAKGFSARVFFDHYNRRLKVLDYQAEHYRPLVERLAWLADQNGFDKVFLKASREDWQRFLSLGYVLEGILKYYFHGRDAFVMSRFGSLQRAQSAHIIEENSLIEAVMRKPPDDRPLSLPVGYTQVLCGERAHPRAGPPVSRRCSGPTRARSPIPTTSSRPCAATWSIARW